MSNSPCCKRRPLFRIYAFWLLPSAAPFFQTERSATMLRPNSNAFAGYRTVSRKNTAIARKRDARARRTLRRGLHYAPKRSVRDSRARGRPARVPGVVHAASATGQTVFVEPLETIEINNRIVQLTEDEAAAITRILAELTEPLRENSDAAALGSGNRCRARLRSRRTRFAREFDCTFPNLPRKILLHRFPA